MIHEGQPPVVARSVSPSLSASNAVQPRLQLRLIGGLEYIVIEVSDTGVGIKPETLSHVFEPFFTTKGEGGGVGLGLSVVYGIVTRHGGLIHVQSTPGVSTTFQVQLPRTQPPEADEGADDHSGTRAGGVANARAEHRVGGGTP